MPGYETQQMGDATEISTNPEAVPAPWLLVAIPGGLLVLIALSTGIIYGVLAAGFVYGAMYLLMHSKQATLYRAPAKFRVSKNGIEVGAATIPKDTIHRVIVRNHVLQAAGDVIIVPQQRPAKRSCRDELGRQQTRPHIVSRGCRSPRRAHNSSRWPDRTNRRRNHDRRQ